jgi:hypothetical protein
MYKGFVKITKNWTLIVHYEAFGSSFGHRSSLKLIILG